LLRSAFLIPPLRLTLAREFVSGNNQTGPLVTNTGSGAVSVVGGEVSSAGEIMTGQAGIYYGEATAASNYFFPSATVEAWNAYLATATNQTSSIKSMGSISSEKTLLGSALAIVLGVLM